MGEREGGSKKCQGVGGKLRQDRIDGSAGR